MITIDEAIELLKERNKHNYAWRGSKLDNAVQLGMEALIRLKGNRQHPQMPVYGPLPGETREGEE